MNACLPRSRGALLKAVSELDVEHNPALQRRALVRGGPIFTFCNWFVEQLLRVLGVEIPGGMLARQQIAWLTGPEGEAAGWQVVGELEAQQLAELGNPVVVGWTNPDPKHSSHVAVVVPAIGGTGTHIAQAGKSNFSSAPLVHGFGADKLDDLVFIAHP